MKDGRTETKSLAAHSVRNCMPWSVLYYCELGHFWKSILGNILF